MTSHSVYMRVCFSDEKTTSLSCAHSGLDRNPGVFPVPAFAGMMNYAALLMKFLVCEKKNYKMFFLWIIPTSFLFSTTGRVDSCSLNIVLMTS